MNGADALARLDSPDLIVLDLMMPLMDGREFLRRLRTVTAHGGPPVLIMTAAPIRSPVEGAQAVMNKPFDLGELLMHVARLINWIG